MWGMRKTVPPTSTVTIRHARSTDAKALADLAQLDSHPELRGEALVGEVAGEIWAAVSLTDYAVIGDPFRPSGELAFLLLERARQLRRHTGRRRRHGLRRPAFA
jgi:hypothetical protein